MKASTASELRRLAHLKRIATAIQLQADAQKLCERDAQHQQETAT